MEHVAPPAPVQGAFSFTCQDMLPKIECWRLCFRLEQGLGLGVNRVARSEFRVPLGLCGWFLGCCFFGFGVSGLSLLFRLEGSGCTLWWDFGAKHEGFGVALPGLSGVGFIQSGYIAASRVTWRYEKREEQITSLQ